MNTQETVALKTDAKLKVKELIGEHCANRTENVIFQDDEREMIVEVRNYNHGNQFRKTKAFHNANANHLESQLKRYGGDVKARLRAKLNASK